MNQFNFLSPETARVLEELVNKEYYLRELAEKLSFSPSSVHQITSDLLKEKILLEHKQKNRKLFRVNFDSVIAREFLRIIFSRRIISSSSFKKLLGLKPKSIYLFGSFAKGRISANSDVDLAIFLEKKIDSLKLISIKRQLSKELKRDVQLIVLTPERINEMQTKKIELLNQIRNKSIVLYGDEIE